MSKKKEIQKAQETAEQYRTEWLAMTPQDHLEGAATLLGVWMEATGSFDELQTVYAQVQTHLLAGLLKLNLPGLRDTAPPPGR